MVLLTTLPVRPEIQDDDFLIVANSTEQASFKVNFASFRESISLETNEVFQILNGRIQALELIINNISFGTQSPPTQLKGVENGKV